MSRPMEQDSPLSLSHSGGPNHPSSSGGAAHVCRSPLRHFPLKHCFSKSGHQASSGITGELLEMQIFSPTPEAQGPVSSAPSPVRATVLQVHLVSATGEDTRSQGSGSDLKLWTPQDAAAAAAHWPLSLPMFTEAPQW